MKTSTQDISTARAALRKRVDASRDQLIDMCRQLLRSPSENPPGDTRAVADVAVRILGEARGAEVERVTAEDPIVNVVARVKGRKPGRRLVFNGHLDTFPVGDPSPWSVDPFGAECTDGRIYGRGVSDMKGGIACSLLAFLLLAECRHSWSGEVVVTLAGDEETMGHRGTDHLLNTVPYAKGDAMICGDAGSPSVLRFGEKGMVWVDVLAKGKAAHGAHVHLGESAVDRLLAAIGELMKLRRLRVETPEQIDRAIRRARGRSEKISGAGETKTLKSVTVNCGVVNGGLTANLVADSARAGLDIRLPAGATVAEVEARIAAALEPLDGITYQITRRYEPNWTAPDHEIVRHAVRCGREVLGRAPAVNMRVGASDSRLYRMRQVPSVVCGLTPHNMGGPDEFVVLEELTAVAQMHALTAFDFLMSRADR